MRKVLFLAAGVACALVGCVFQVSSYLIDEYKFSEETSDWDITIRYDVFSSSNQKIKESFQVLNDEIRKVTDRLKADVEQEATVFFKTYSTDSTARPAWKYELNIQDSVFTLNYQYVSSRLSIYTFTGGAHGMTTYQAFNYDVKQKKLLTNEQVIDYTKSDTVNRLLKKHFNNPGQCFHTEPTLAAVNAITFTDETVCFLYEAYVLGAYACGVAEVNVPRKELGSAFILRE